MKNHRSPLNLLLAFVLLVVFASSAFAQVSIRSTLDSRYFAKAFGDTLSPHNTEHKAIQKILREQYPDLDITIISSFGSPYYAISKATGDTISTHNRIDQAIEAAVNSGFPDTKVVRELQLRINDANHIVAQSLELDIFVDDDPIIITEIDTVWQDTLFIDTAPNEVEYSEFQDPTLLTDIEWTHVRSLENGSTTIIMDVHTTAPFVDYQYNCIAMDSTYRIILDEEAWPEEKAYIHTSGSGTDSLGVSRSKHEFTTVCRDDIRYRVDAYKENKRAMYTDIIQLPEFEDDIPYEDEPVLTEEQFQINFAEAEETVLSNFTQYWRDNSTLTLANEELVFDLTSTGSQAWIWEGVPLSTDMEFYVKVRKDLSSTNNLHVKVLADKEAMTSREVYLSGGGLLYNWWDNGSWGSGEEAPLEYSDGDIVHKLVRVEGNMFYAKAWVDGTPEPGWMITTELTNRPEAGFVGFGAHNVGTRYILEMSAGINGAEAPR